jgi:FdhE protein
MPYVAIDWPSREALLALASARADRAMTDRPDLASSIALQRRLLSIVIDLGHLIDSGRLPRLSLPPRYLAAKLARGVPALAGEPIPLPVRAIEPSLVRLCDELAAGGAGEPAARIKGAIESGALDAGSLLTASLSREQAIIRTGAEHRGLAPDLTWLVAELAVGPVAHALQRTLLQAPAEPLAAALAAWDRGYCPACGSWPALAEVVEGHRVLRCSFCAAGWELRTYACVYCGEGGQAFVTAAPNQEHKDRRVELCAACGAYLKAVEAPSLSPYPLLTIADLETMDLDVAAVEHHYGRPPMRAFAARR